MRHFIIVSTVSIFAATASVAQAGPAAPVSGGNFSAIQFVQDKTEKKETVKQKVKRVWRNLTGTKFDVGCPTLAIALNRTTCTATGKKADAMAKCQQQHPLCQVAEQKR